MSDLTVFSVGHSTHSYERFLKLLREAGVTAIADVRTSPFSRHSPQFNRDALRDDLRMGGIAYSFLGKELGGRPTGREFYRDGVADYELMAKTTDFRYGLERVEEGARKYRIALMCSEQDPLDCHRCLLVGRALVERGVTIMHILSDGAISTHREIEERMLKSEGQEGADLFLSPNERLAQAYRKRAEKVAYAEQADTAIRRKAAVWR